MSSADSIVASWLASLRGTDGGRPRNSAVERSYRALGRDLMRLALTGRPDTVECPDGSAALDRSICAVADATRRADLGIAQTVEDVRGLEAVTLRRLWDEARAGGAWADALARTVRLVLLLGTAEERLVRILEERDLRSRREHAAALAATTDMLSHELGNRLGAAVTASELLTDPTIQLDVDGVARAASVVRASVEAALDTVDDVRALVSRCGTRHES